MSWGMHRIEILVILLSIRVVISDVYIPFSEYECPIDFSKPPRNVIGDDSSSKIIASTAYPSSKNNPRITITCKHNINAEVRNYIEHIFVKNEVPSSLKTNSAYLTIKKDNTFVNITYFDSRAITLNQLAYFLFVNNSKNIKIIESGLIFNMIPSIWKSKYSYSKTVLIEGDTVRIGPFKAGQNIGFALYKDGFNLQHKTSNYLYIPSNWDYPPPPFYSVVSYPYLVNPDSSCPDKINSLHGCKHMAWVFIKKYNIIAFGFEDSIDLTSLDYNDNLFYLSISEDFDAPNLVSYYNGNLQMCESLYQININSYKIIKCQQYGLLESENNGCFGHMQPPLGWKLAPDNEETISLIKKMAKTDWAYTHAECFIVEGGIAYNAYGDLCPSKMVSDITSYDNCYRLDCSIRYVLKGEDISECFSNIYCSSNEDGYSISQIPSSLSTWEEGEYFIFPEQYNIRLNSVSGNISLSSLISIPKNNIKADIAILVDFYGMSMEDIDNFRGSPRWTVNSVFERLENAGFYVDSQSKLGLRLLFSFCIPMSSSEYFLSVPGTFSNSIDVLSRQLESMTYSSFYSNYSSFIPECTAELLNKYSPYWRSNVWRGIWIISNQKSWKSKFNLTEIQSQSGIAIVLYNPKSYCESFFWDYNNTLNIPYSFINASKAMVNCGPSVWADWYTSTDELSTLYNMTSKINPYAFSDVDLFQDLHSSFSIIEHEDHSQMDYMISWSNLYNHNHLKNPFDVKIGILGYGNTKINVSFNQIPVATNIVLKLTHTGPHYFNLPVYDDDYEGIMCFILSLPTHGTLRKMDGTLIESSNTQITGTSLVYEPSSKCRSCIDEFTWVPFDGCALGNYANVTISLWTEKVPQIEDLEFSVYNNQKCRKASEIIDLSEYIYFEDDITGKSQNPYLIYFGSIPNHLGVLYSYSEDFTKSYTNIGLQESYRICFEPNPGMSGISKANVVYQIKSGLNNVFSNTATIIFNIIYGNDPPTILFSSSNILISPGYFYKLEYMIYDPDDEEGGTLEIDYIYRKSDSNLVQSVYCDSSDTIDVNSGDIDLPFVCTKYQMFNNKLFIGNLYWNNNGDSTLGEIATISLVAKDKQGENSNTFNITLNSGSSGYYWILVPPLIVEMDQDEVVVNLKYGAKHDGSQMFNLGFKVSVPPSHGSLLLYGSDEDFRSSKIYEFSGCPDDDNKCFFNDNYEYDLDSSYMEIDGNKAYLLIGYIPNSNYLGVDLFTIVLSDANDNVFISRTVGIVINLPKVPKYSDMKIFVRENSRTRISIPAFYFTKTGLKSNCSQISQTVIITKTLIETSSIYSINNGANIDIPHMETIDLSKDKEFEFEFFSPLGAYKDTKNPYGVIEFYICDNCGLCIDNHIMEIYVVHVNHAPTSKNYYGIAKIKEILPIHLYAADIDPGKDRSYFKAQITSLGPKNKGNFYLDSEGTSEVTVDTFLPNCTMYYISRYDYSKPETVPLARFTYVIWDEFMQSSSTYFGQVIVLRSTGQIYSGPLMIKVIQGVNGTIALKNPEYLDDNFDNLNIQFFITRLPDKGNLYHLSDEEDEINLADYSNTDLIPLNSMKGIIIYEPPPDEWGNSTIPLTYFNFVTIDKSNDISFMWTMKIFLIHVNKAPVLKPLYMVDFRGIGDMTLNYHEMGEIEWMAQDPDSPPNLLVSNIAISPYVGEECTLKYFEDGTCDFGWGFVRHWKNNRRVKHDYFKSENCVEREEVLREGCESHFKFKFFFSRLYYIPYLVISLQVMDEHYASSKIERIFVTVTKSNEPPTIEAPKRIYSESDMVNLNNNGEWVKVSDSDSYGNRENLTITLVKNTLGDLIVPEEHVSKCSKLRSAGGNKTHWECFDSIDGFNEWLPKLKFQVKSNTNSYIMFTINDMGHTSNKDPSPRLTASKEVEIIIGSGRGSLGSTLGITLGAAAGSALLLTSAILYYLKRRRSLPSGIEPGRGDQGASSVSNNPLYQGDNQQFESPIYQRPSHQ